MAITKKTNLVIPQVMSDIISATLPKAIKFAPIAYINRTLVGNAGDTITVPKFAYIGDAEDVAEGVAMGTTVLTASTTTATIKKIGKAAELTDESVLSAKGDIVGQTTMQLGMAIASKIDEDCVTALCGASMTHQVEGIIGYKGIIEAAGKLCDENDDAVSKVMFVHPDQYTQLLLDPDFISKDKFGGDVAMTGVVGMIGGIQIVKSKRVKESGGYYSNPIVVVDAVDPNQAPDADEYGVSDAALSIYMKRDVQVESDRDILAKTTVVSADEHYGVVLTNDSKVVLAKFKKTAE